MKSRRIRSARAAAAGSGMVVFFHRFAARPCRPGLPHQPGDPLAAMPPARGAQRGMDPRGAVAALGLLVHRLDLRGQLGVLRGPPRRPARCCVEGGTGDLQQLARPLDVVPAALLRLDERVARSPGLLREESRGPLEDLHVLAQPAVLPPQLRQLLALVAGQAAVLRSPRPARPA